MWMISTERTLIHLLWFFWHFVCVRVMCRLITPISLILSVFGPLVAVSRTHHIRCFGISQQPWSWCDPLTIPFEPFDFRTIIIWFKFVIFILNFNLWIGYYNYCWKKFNSLAEDFISQRFWFQCLWMFSINECINEYSVNVIGLHVFICKS